MANFVLLFTGGSGMAQTEAEQAATLAAWGVWYGALGSAIVDGGNPFSPSSRSIASDGTVSEAPLGTPATGYTIISAGSIDAAVELAQGCPVLKDGGQISVYETFPVM